MNIQQINNEVYITEFLERIGIQPVKIRGNDYWYISPVREPEHTPSFKVNTRINRWYDHGTGEGGKLIDLVVRLYQPISISEAIGKINELFLFSSANNRKHNFSLLSRPVISKPAVGPSSDWDNEKDNKLIIDSTRELGNHKKLSDYLETRGISPQIAKAWCREVCFSIAGKHYYAIGFENRSGGYELRNDWFKGASSPKDITFIDIGSKSVCVLEGFIDFLSLMELRENQQPGTNFLILNSVSMIGKSIEVLKAHQDIFFFLDHDEAGSATARKLIDLGIEGVDSAGFYQGYKDINEYLAALKQAGRCKSLSR